MNIPQKALIKKTDYVINEQDWDDGITALFTQYSYWIKYHQKKSPEQKLNLHSGINIGAWRVRSQSGFNWRKDSHQSKLSHQFMHIDKLILFLLFFMEVSFHPQHEYYQMIK